MVRFHLQEYDNILEEQIKGKKKKKEKVSAGRNKLNERRNTWKKKSIPLSTFALLTNFVVVAVVVVWITYDAADASPSAALDKLIECRPNLI